MTYAACLFSGRSHRARTDRKEYDMLKKIRDIITEKNMIAPGERLILGLSGGRDSVCLFHVLRKLGPEMGFSFFAVHVMRSSRMRSADSMEYRFESSGHLSRSLLRNGA